MVPPRGHPLRKTGHPLPWHGHHGNNIPPPPFLIPSSQPPLDSAIPHRLMIDEVGSQLFQAIEFRLTLFLTLIGCKAWRVGTRLTRTMISLGAIASAFRHQGKALSGPSV